MTKSRRPISAPKDSLIYTCQMRRSVFSHSQHSFNQKRITKSQLSTFRTLVAEDLDGSKVLITTEHHNYIIKRKVHILRKLVIYSILIGVTPWNLWETSTDILICKWVINGLSKGLGSVMNRTSTWTFWNVSEEIRRVSPRFRRETESIGNGNKVTPNTRTYTNDVEGSPVRGAG